jgi:hypothetical protein
VGGHGIKSPPREAQSGATADKASLGLHMTKRPGGGRGGQGRDQGRQCRTADAQTADSGRTADSGERRAPRDVSTERRPASTWTLRGCLVREG